MKIINSLWAELNANLFPNNIVNFTSVLNSGANKSHRFRNFALRSSSGIICGPNLGTISHEFQQIHATNFASKCFSPVGLSFIGERCKLCEFIRFLCSDHVTYQIWSWLPKVKAISNRRNMANSCYFSEGNSVSFPEKCSAWEGLGFAVLCLRSVGVKRICAYGCFVPCARIRLVARAWGFCRGEIYSTENIVEKKEL